MGNVIMFPKPHRKNDPQVIIEVKSMCCAACGAWPSDPHHVTTRGAGGGDTMDNVMPLCHTHHTELHACGYNHMLQRYPGFADWLKANGRDDVFERAARMLP